MEGVIFEWKEDTEKQDTSFYFSLKKFKSKNINQKLFIITISGKPLSYAKNSHKNKCFKANSVNKFQLDTVVLLRTQTSMYLLGRH